MSHQLPDDDDELEDWELLELLESPEEELEVDVPAAALVLCVEVEVCTVVCPPLPLPLPELPLPECSLAPLSDPHSFWYHVMTCWFCAGSGHEPSHIPAGEL